MGEGIRNAKIVSLLKKPGDPDRSSMIELCEVETDKAVYPIQSSFAGVMGEWKTKVGDTVEIGQELGTLFTDDEPSVCSRNRLIAAAVGKLRPVERCARATARRLQNRASAFAYDHAQTRHVIPANLQIDARWDANSESSRSSEKERLRSMPPPLP